MQKWFKLYPKAIVYTCFDPRITLDSDRHSPDSAVSVSGVSYQGSHTQQFFLPQIWHSGGDLDALKENKVIFEIWNDCKKKL